MWDEDSAIRAASAAFLEYDSEAKGFLTRHEYKAAHLALFGWKPSLVHARSAAPISVQCTRPACTCGHAAHELVCLFSMSCQLELDAVLPKGTGEARCELPQWCSRVVPRLCT